MVPFAGYSMPVQYNDGVLNSHLFCRSDVVIFDVSHMLQTSVKGKDAVLFMESVTVCDVEELKPNSGSLTVFTTNKGTIIDDLIVSKITNHELYVVSNASCAEKDLKLLHKQEIQFREWGKDVTVEVIQKSLIAVQGPKMMTLLQPLVDFDMKAMPFMSTRMSPIPGIGDIRITRCGYTGEDGVEMQVENDKAADLVDLLTNSKNAECRLAGLAARDSLRLEAGLCLYGNDIDETTTPNEASLVWLIGKNRRRHGGFPGSDIILRQIEDKSVMQKKRVGMIVQGAPARQGAAVVSPDGASKFGTVTSGCPSPSLKQNIAMAYVHPSVAKTGTKLAVRVRDKTYDAIVTKMPFVPTKYYFVWTDWEPKILKLNLNLNWTIVWYLLFRLIERKNISARGQIKSADFFWLLFSI